MSIISVPYFDLGFPYTIGSSAVFGAITNNLAGENGGAFGTLELEGGTVGGSKTLSAAGGGKILIATGAVVWATGPSEYRVGLEDMTPLTGMPDGTQDVYGAKIAGVNAIAASSIVEFPMTVGSKTVNHGDFIGITGRMPARAGTDSLALGSIYYQFYNAPKNRPYGMGNTVKSYEGLWAFIIFDDGTCGWIRGTVLYSFSATVTPWNPASVPNEYAATFEVVVPVRLCSIGWPESDNQAAGDDYDMRVFSSPYAATPVQIAGGNIDTSATQVPSSGYGMQWGDITPVVLMPGFTYSVAMRMTSGQIATYYYTMTGAAGNGPKIKKMLPFIKNVKMASRSGNTGPFTETNVDHMPIFGLGFDGLEDGISSGGGASSHAFA